MRFKAKHIFIWMFFLCIFANNAFADETLGITISNEKVIAGEKTEVVVKTSGMKTGQVFVKVYDENHKLVLDKYKGGSIPSFIGEELKFNLILSNEGKYRIEIKIRDLDERFRIDEYSIDVECKKKEKKKIVYLTFDDGPSSITPKVLDILDEYEIKATFFVIGQLAERYPDMIKEINNRGHIVANHSYSHEYSYIYSNTENLIGEIEKTDEILKGIIDGYDVKMFRFPGGSFHRTKFKEAVDNIGYKHFNWHIDSGDTHASVVPEDTIVANIANYLLYERSVILFHDAPGKVTLPEALRGTIDMLLEKGYEFRQLQEDSFNSF